MAVLLAEPGQTASSDPLLCLVGQARRILPLRVPPLLASHRLIHAIIIVHAVEHHLQGLVDARQRQIVLLLPANIPGRSSANAPIRILHLLHRLDIVRCYVHLQPLALLLLHPVGSQALVEAHLDLMDASGGEVEMDGMRSGEEDRRRFRAADWCTEEGEARVGEMKVE